MIRRWIRAVARTWPVRPSPAPPPVGRRCRTLLRLEAVEDRTLASAAAVDPPDLVPAATEAHAADTAPSTKPKPDDQSDAGSTQSDQLVPVTASAADMPVMMTGGGWNTWVGDAPVPSVNRHETVFSAQFNASLGVADESVPSPTPAHGRAQASEPDAPPAAGLDGTAPAGTGVGSAPADSSTATPPARVAPTPPASPSPDASAVSANS